MACDEWRDKKKRLNAERTENAEGTERRKTRKEGFNAEGTENAEATERKRGRRDKREKRRAGLKPSTYKIGLTKLGLQNPDDESRGKPRLG